LTPRYRVLRVQPDIFAGEDTISGQRVAYARVSTLDQNTARQLDGVVVDRTFTDSASGKDVNRPQLAAMLGFVREGDTVVTHSMDRLARNLDDLRRIVRELTAKGVQVQFVKEQLTFTGEDTAMSNLLLSVMVPSPSLSGRLSVSGNAKASRWPRRAAPTAAARDPSPRNSRSSCDSGPARGKRRRSWLASSASAARPCTSTCGHGRATWSLLR
jgi:hypothetical protein